MYNNERRKTMKKIIATIAASVLSVAAMAQKPGDGVLRIHTTDGEVTPIFTKNIKSMTFEEVTSLSRRPAQTTSSSISPCPRAAPTG